MWVLDVWYFYVNISVSMIMGMIISSIRLVVIRISVFFLVVIIFFGFRIVRL